MTGRAGSCDDDVLLAEQLLADWDEVRGASKNEIERRVWGDDGAHRFDRFIRQTPGATTSKRPKQTGRIGELKSQLRRLGVAPRGTTLKGSSRDHPKRPGRPSFSMVVRPPWLSCECGRPDRHAYPSSGCRPAARPAQRAASQP